MKRFLIVAVIVVFVLGAVALATTAYRYRFLFDAVAQNGRRIVLSQATIDRITAWAAGQRVPEGREKSLTLPPELAAWSATGKVDAAHLRDGRLCVLLITVLGYKDNFEGVLSCTAPLADSEIVKSPDYANSSYISLPGYGAFEELYVRAKRSDRVYDVYFDLN